MTILLGHCCSICWLVRLIWEARSPFLWAMTQTFLWFLLQTTTIGGSGSRINCPLWMIRGVCYLYDECLLKVRSILLPFTTFHTYHTYFTYYWRARWSNFYITGVALYSGSQYGSQSFGWSILYATATLYVLDLHNWPQLHGQRILYVGKIIMKAYPNLIPLITLDVIITLSTRLYISSLIHFPIIAPLPGLYILSLNQLSFITILSSSMYRYYQPPSIKDFDRNPVISCKLLFCSPAHTPLATIHDIYPTDLWSYLNLSL
jgi:hypothetical protein